MLLPADKIGPSSVNMGLAEEPLDDTCVLPLGSSPALVVVAADVLKVVLPRRDICSAEAATPGGADRETLIDPSYRGRWPNSVLSFAVLGQYNRV
jgi:hypothetical protein